VGLSTGVSHDYARISDKFTRAVHGHPKVDPGQEQLISRHPSPLRVSSPTRQPRTWA
jgi:hypothetical protein